MKMRCLPVSSMDSDGLPQKKDDRLSMIHSTRFLYEVSESFSNINNE